MRVFGLSLAVAALTTSSLVAAPGDQWVLGIHHIDNEGDKPFTAYTGGGYQGAQSWGTAQFTGNAYGYSKPASSTGVGVNRIWWELNGNSVNNSTSLSATPQLYKVEYFAPSVGGHSGYQPLEANINGPPGDAYPIEPNVPWGGKFGTNHQWIRVYDFFDNAFHAMGPGPQTDTVAPADGTMLWLKPGAWLYAKWDFTDAINRTWSALRLTQVTPVAGPIVSGDYNKNGTVDAADYILWRKTEGSQGANLPADGYPDGFINEYDYDVWREAFGNHNGSGTGNGLSSLTAIPEPAAIVFVAIAVAVFFSVPRRRAMLACCPEASMRNRSFDR